MQLSEKGHLIKFVSQAEPNKCSPCDNKFISCTLTEVSYSMVSLFVELKCKFVFVVKQYCQACDMNAIHIEPIVYNTGLIIKILK